MQNPFKLSEDDTVVLPLFQSELDKLRGEHPIIELIEQTRELAKLKNTYTDALVSE